MIERFVRIQISGKVQGVYFRAYTQNIARSLNIKGWVQNLGNGDVCIEAFGNLPDMETFIRWCSTGSPDARVEKVFVSDIPHFHEVDFKIRR
ncbi:MAG: acylphosphatase [Saprospiraceae bacterium]|nr:acylphosphatase [Saprospiraceae bacterium]